MAAPVPFPDLADLRAVLPERPLQDLLRHVNSKVFYGPEDPRFPPRGSLDLLAFRNTLNDLLELFLRAPHWRKDGFRERVQSIRWRSESPRVRELVGLLLYFMMLIAKDSSSLCCLQATPEEIFAFLTMARETKKVEPSREKSYLEQPLLSAVRRDRHHVMACVGGLTGRNPTAGMRGLEGLIQRTLHCRLTRRSLPRTDRQVNGTGTEEADQ